jgi:chromosome segregation ATPase
LKLHDELASVAESCLDLKSRVKNLEQKTETAADILEKHDGDLALHGSTLNSFSKTLDNHEEKLNELINLKSHLEKIHSDLKEMQNQREIMNGNNGGNGVDDETVSKLQVKLLLNRLT